MSTSKTDRAVTAQERQTPIRTPGALRKHAGRNGALVAMLQEIQDQHGYLPEARLRALAGETGISLVDIYGVATFYRSFSLTPRGRHLIRVCLGTACHVRGAARIVEEFERQLGIAPGDTTPDGEVTLETVNCLGACALGPIVMVDGDYFSNVDAANVDRILESIAAVSTESPRDA